jgi:hypothetical protein
MRQTQALQVSRSLLLNVLFHMKENKLPTGMPSMRISSPDMELDNGPKGDDEDGSTTVVSQ